MDLFINDLWFWNIVIFIYFSLKSRLLSKIFKIKPGKYNLLLTLVFTTASLILNSLMYDQYVDIQRMGVVRGAIKLPPFTILFILSDFISTTYVFIAFIHKRGAKAIYHSAVQVAMESIRFTVIAGVFTFLLSFYYQKEALRLSGWDYVCFQTQLAIDYAAYYYKNGEDPKYLEDFTEYRVNPFNDSKLELIPGDYLNVKVVDEFGNNIMRGADNLFGLRGYERNPSRFFEIIMLKNDTLCSGKLKVPPEFGSESGE